MWTRRTGILLVMLQLAILPGEQSLPFHSSVSALAYLELSFIQVRSRDHGLGPVISFNWSENTLTMHLFVSYSFIKK